MKTKPAKILWLIWLAFIVRGAFYAAVLPIWEGFDEYAHFAFVHHLKTFGALPRADELVSGEISRSLRLVPLPWSLNNWASPAVTHDAYWQLSPEERALRQEALKILPTGLQTVQEGEYVEEAKQPPAYYVLATLVLEVVQGTSLPSRVLALRLFSIVLASLVIPLTFALSRRILGEAQALLATILIAAMPGLLMDVSRVGNDCLAIVIFGVLVWALVRSEPWDARGAALIGVTLGVGLLTKAYFVAAGPAILVSGAMAILGAARTDRLRCFGRVSAAMALALVLSGWWYLRTLGAGGQIWVDAAPLSPVAPGGLVQYAVRMDWWEAVKVILNGHFWVGGWSFLGVRSWIYDVLRAIFLIALPAGFLWMIRNRQRFSAVWLLYAGFWAALMYHAFVNFINSGVPASTGWYLYAVASCEAVLLCSAAQWLGPRVQGYAMASLTGLFLLLEAYATHFVLIPYYIGLISHRPDTSITAFTISQAADLGWSEVLSRIVVNRAAIVGPGTIVVLWLAFVFASIALFGISCRRCLADHRMARD